MSEKARKSIPLRQSLFLSAFLAVVFGASYFFSRPPDLSGHPLEGKGVPPLTYRLPDGATQSLGALGGKVVLINFWAIWCQPCLEEMPSLAALENHFGKQGLVVLAFDLGDGRERLEKRLADRGYPKNLVSDYSREHLAPFRVHTLPLTLLVDRNGLVREVVQGARDWMSVSSLNRIKALLD